MASEISQWAGLPSVTPQIYKPNQNIVSETLQTDTEYTDTPHNNTIQVHEQQINETNKQKKTDKPSSTFGNLCGRMYIL